MLSHSVSCVVLWTLGLAVSPPGRLGCRTLEEPVLPEENAAGCEPPVSQPVAAAACSVSDGHGGSLR